jgi:NADPH-dependent 2,4-dienoyl-CoA reductase/sulfur reductase-like enzyme
MRVAVIGGGFAGATLAKYLRLWGKKIDVTLFEPSTRFISCPMSNLVIGGSRSMHDLTHGYGELGKRHGVKVVHARVTAVDLEKRRLKAGGKQFNFDRLVIAPGIDFRYELIEGMQSREAKLAMPHAWRAGDQTIALRDSLRAIPRDGRFIISIPRGPLRCPAAPYERASQVAFFMRHAKPRGKVIVLDANADILAKGDAFQSAWKNLYPGLIEYRSATPTMRVEHKKGLIHTDLDTLRGDVVNIIPPQRAGRAADLVAAANVAGQWCEVDFLTYESKVAPNVHIIGDAVFSGLPKSAHIANAQAKVCAAALVAIEADIDPVGEPVFANTCYSFVSASEAAHIATVFRYHAASRSMRAEGHTQSGLASRFDAYYAKAWTMNIWQDTLG